ncbi:hypothetical protein M3Y94_00502400 [Aphelenchoides besseyi]|nr:hypothetical protein M3Y94_00502400 [Aphelenchoides besseyi]
MKLDDLHRLLCHDLTICPPSAPSGLRRTVTSNSTASLPQPSSTEIGRRESEPALLLDETVSDSSRPPSRTGTLTNRSKSPSLASLRRKATLITPSCFRGEKDRNDERLAYTPTASRESLQTPTKTVRSIFWPSRTSSTPSLVHNPTLSTPKNKRDEEIVDPVEAAIRSLESFDPNECFKPPTTTNGQFRSTSSINTLRDDTPTPRHASAQSSGTVTPTAPVRLRYTTPLLPTTDTMGARNSSLANQTSQNRHELPPRSQRASDPQPENKESRSRAYRSHLTECVKRVEIGALRIENFASLPQWRDADQLRRSLPTIHETLIDVEHATSELINSAARLSFQRNDPEFNELQRLTDPLRSAHSLLSRLRRTLDQSNWSISSLSRPVRTHLPNDPLDQIVAILRHLPTDTSRFAQWVYGLLTRRDRTVLLPHGISSAPPPPFHSRENHRSEHQTPTQNRNQPPKTPTVHFATPLTYGRDARSDTMDGGSTTSSNSSPREDESSRRSESTLNRGDNDEDSESVASQIVMEEDDLASVVSDMAEHPWTQNNNRHTTIDRKSHNADTKRALEAQKQLNDDERDFIRFCSPKFDQHANSLNQQVEELFQCIEEGRRPDKFVKTIALETQILCALSANVARRLSQPILRAEFKHAAERLDNLISECENVANSIRKSQSPSVSAAQALVTTVVQITKKAQNLKLLAKNMCY